MWVFVCVCVCLFVKKKTKKNNYWSETDIAYAMVNLKVINKFWQHLTSIFNLVTAILTF